MTKKSSKNLLDTVDTFIGDTAVFEGNISTEKTISIDGILKGNIVKAAGVLIGAKADIKGDINAEVVMIAGKITGNITALESIEILPQAVVAGDIKTNILTVQEGAHFEGRSSMIPDAEENGAEKQ
ncbi:MAG: polymer-forming cytoskeletal protein [Endomicrobia bacterium]|nr:polymer-forming cytoskeletal protein [Endomicrobiia bacterium]